MSGEEDASDAMPGRVDRSSKPCRAPIRCQRRSRRGSSCAGRVPSGDRGRCWTGSRRRAWRRCRVAARCMGVVAPWGDRAGQARTRRDDCRRWERGGAVELWQMDVIGRIFLARRQRATRDHRRRSPLEVLRVRPARGSSDSEAGVRGAGMGDARSWDAGSGPDQQRQGGHRPRSGVGPVLFDRVSSDNGIPSAHGRIHGRPREGGAVSSHPASRWVRPNDRRSRRSWRRRHHSTSECGKLDEDVLRAEAQAQGVFSAEQPGTGASRSTGDSDRSHPWHRWSSGSQRGSSSRRALRRGLV